MKKVYLCLAHMSGNEMKYIQEAFDTNWVVPLGPNVDAFENELRDYVTGGKAEHADKQVAAFDLTRAEQITA